MDSCTWKNELIMQEQAVMANMMDVPEGVRV
jgi:hypothetical protein